MRILAFDTETTGLNVREARIIDLCMVELDEQLGVLANASWRFKPEVPIPPEATAVHGITNEAVAGKPTFRQHAARIQWLLDGATLVAFNGIRYDIPILNEELVRAGQAGISPTHPVIDPYLLYLEDQPRNLQAAAKHYLNADFKAHDANADTLAMVEVLRAQHLRRERPPLKSLVREPEKAWLDHDRRFYRDESGVVRLAFGKHKGTPAAEHHEYLRWMLSLDFSRETKKVARQVLAEVTHEPLAAA